MLTSAGAFLSFAGSVAGGVCIWSSVALSQERKREEKREIEMDGRRGGGAAAQKRDDRRLTSVSALKF